MGPIGPVSGESSAFPETLPEALALPGTELRERNRELLAERLHWPKGALEVTRRLEAVNPGTSVWWGTGRVNSPKPGFYALRGDGHHARTFYGASAGDLQNVLTAHPFKLSSW